MRGGEKDGAGRHFGFKDWCDRLGFAPHLVERPVELRGIDRRQIDHCQMTSSLSWMISLRRLSVKPLIAALAPQ